MITRPSRITSHTATFLDNIFANTFFDHSRSGLLTTDISDHLPVFSIHSNNDSSNSHARDPVVIRNNNKENLASFLETLKEITWSSLDGYRDPKNAYNSFIKKYSESYNVCFPVKKLTRKQSRLNKPLLSNALIKCIKKKNRLSFASYSRSPRAIPPFFCMQFSMESNHYEMKPCSQSLSLS